MVELLNYFNINLYYIIPEFAFGIILIAIFFYDLVRHVAKGGFVLDCWFISVFMGCMLPIVIISPFSCSDISLSVIGGREYIRDRLPEAYLISAIGISSIFFGAFFGNLRFSSDVSSNVSKNVVGRAIAFANAVLYEVVRDRISFYITSLLFLTAGVVTAIFVFSSSALDGGLRAAELGNDGIRPFINLLFVSVIPLITQIVIAKWGLGKARLFDVVLGVSSVVLSAVSSSKSVILMPAMLICIIISQRLKRKSLAFLFLASCGASLGALGLIINFLRSAGTGSGQSATLLPVLLEALYGNALSDLRDFSWFLSDWNGQLYYGATWLAGAISFVPRSISDFREHYALGVVTATTVGLNPLEHAGIRIGPFGESYINFGYMGVGLVSFLFGYVVKYLQVWARRLQETLPNHREYAFIFSIMVAGLLFLIMNTAGFWELYATIGFFVTFKAVRWLIRADYPAGVAAKGG